MLSGMSITPPYTIEDEILRALSDDEGIIDKNGFHKVKNTVLAKYRVSE
jgi:hypothetical protein